jgi:hypothetical protein
MQGADVIKNFSTKFSKLDHFRVAVKIVCNYETGKLVSMSDNICAMQIFIELAIKSDCSIFKIFKS